jgi:hypothetical protein
MTKSERSLKTIVGSETYRVWLAMLKRLVPGGRTHRLAPIVAGMLQYASDIASDKYSAEAKEGSVAYSLLTAAEMDDPDEIMKELRDVTERLFEEAGVAAGRTSARGDDYSIAEEAIYHFIHWYDMPWES